jgi:flagellin
MSNSILTNTSAYAALQSLSASTADLNRIDAVIASGLKVAGAADDPASYALAQTLRGQSSGWAAVSDSLGRAQSTVDVAAAGSEQISDILGQLKAKATAYADPSLNSVDRAALRTDAQALIAQVDEVSQASSFDGAGLIAGQGVPGVVSRTATQSAYAQTSPATPQSFSSVIGATSSETHASETMYSSTTYTLPYSTLTPGSFAQAVQSLNSVSSSTNIYQERSVLTGPQSEVLQVANPYTTAQSASASVALDAYTDPAGFTVSQGGAVLATSAGPPQSGRQSLSYTFNPTGPPVTVTSSSPGVWSVLSSASEGDPSSETSSATVGQTSDGQPLALDTAGAPANQGVQSYTLDGGGQAGRVDMVFDAGVDPDTVEIDQNGVPVAASGQAYTPGGGAVGAATPVTGQSVLSFDYDPSKGTNLTISVNPGSSNGNAGWAVGALSLAPSGSPLPTAQGATTTSTSEESQLQVDDPDTDYTGPVAPLTPELNTSTSGTQTYTLAAGSTGGQVQLQLDAYASPDVVEIYQDGVRVAASGQPAGSNGAAVTAGQPVTGQQTLSFDYNPALGQTLSLQVTQADPAASDGWTIQDMTLQAGVTDAYPLAEHDTSATVPYAFIKAPDGSQLRIQSRDLTSTGLGLANLDWSDPDSVLAAVDAAETSANSAAEYFGEQDQLVGGLLAQATQRQGTLQTGTGNLVDADMAAASATQQADQTRQQLATQALSIANAAPSNLLALFRS